MQQTKLIISPERADFWLLGPFLISSVSQSTIIILLAAKWSRKMQWPGNGRVPASFLGLGELLRPDMDKAHAMAHAARCDMACVCDVNSFGGGPSWDPGLADRCPCRRETERDRRRVVVRWGRAENFRAHEDANEKGWNLMYTVYQVDALTRSQAYCLLTSAAHLLVAARGTGTPSPRRQAQARPILQPCRRRRLSSGPGRISEGRPINPRNPRQTKQSRCVKQQHHTTPNQYEERGRGGRRRSR